MSVIKLVKQENG